jgi:hypothetical protein
MKKLTIILFVLLVVLGTSCSQKTTKVAIQETKVVRVFEQEATSEYTGNPFLKGELNIFKIKKSNRRNVVAKNK